MKYIVVLGDGMADRPLKELGGRTPLEVAHKPAMDFIAREGRCGLLKTLREDMPYGSDVANLSIMGYDPKKYYPGGRGPLEAAALGIRLGERDLAFRCNLITVENGFIADYSGGHISSAEAEELIDAVNRRFGGEGLEFYSGVGYRHILVVRDSPVSYRDFVSTPPHDVVGQRINDNLMKAKKEYAEEFVERLNRVMVESKDYLDAHRINVERVKCGKNPANMLWFWGAGRKPAMPSFKEKYGISGSLISAVDLLRGMAVFLGLEVIDVPGITGYSDTNYSGKADYALKALRRHDLIYVHVEAPDELSHEGNIYGKIKAIEEIDRKIVSKLLEEMSGEDYSIAVLPDHATPLEVRTHTSEPVPFAIYSSCGGGDGVVSYSEKAAACGSYGLRDGTEFMDILLGRK